MNPSVMFALREASNLKHRSMIRTFLLMGLATAAAYAQTAAVDGATRADWPHYGGSQFSWRYSALDQIDTANVKNLAPAWIFQTGDYSEGLQATPIVVDGVMYLITPRANVFALDAGTGRVIWNISYLRRGGRGWPGALRR